MGPIEKRALEILNSLDGFLDIPASISGKYHYGENMEDHLIKVVKIIKDLCREFKVSEEDTDMLSAVGWLHDIGRYIITAKGDVSKKASNWTYFEKTGYSRQNDMMEKHPIIGSRMLLESDKNIPRKKEIQRLIEIHMSHWYPEQPQPDLTNLFEIIICTSDYLASRKKYD